MLLAAIPVERLTYEQVKELLLLFGAGGLILVTVCICVVLFFRRPPWGRKPTE